MPTPALPVFRQQLANLPLTAPAGSHYKPKSWRGFQHVTPWSARQMTSLVGSAGALLLACWSSRHLDVLKLPNTSPCSSCPCSCISTLSRLCTRASRLSPRSAAACKRSRYSTLLPTCSTCHKSCCSNGMCKGVLQMNTSTTSSSCLLSSQNQ